VSSARRLLRCTSPRWHTSKSRSEKLIRLFPFIERIFADGSYRGPKAAQAATRTGTWKLEIVDRPDHARFEVLPKRWIVERTIAWLSRFRRLMRDFQRYAGTVASFIRLAMIRIMLRRLTRSNA
jgi:transposase